MHQTLLDVAIRKAWTWVVVAVVVSALPPAALIGVAFDHSLITVGVLWVVLVLVSAVMLTLPPPFAPDVKRLKGIVAPASPNIQSLVEQISVALGIPPVPAMVVEHTSLNVGVVRGEDARRSVLLTSATVARLDKYELEALVANALTMCNNLHIARLVRVASWMTLARWSLLFIMLGFLPFMWLLLVPLAAFTIWGGPMFFFLPKVLSWLAVASDGATVATTRYPEPLAKALIDVALDDSVPMPMGFWAKFGAADLAWVVPPSVSPAPMTTWVNGKKTSVTSTAFEADMRLLLSSEMVREVCLHGRPATFDVWRSVAGEFAKARKALAADVDQVRVGPYVVGLNGLRSMDQSEPTP